MLRSQQQHLVIMPSMTTTFAQAGFDFEGPEALSNFLESVRDQSKLFPTPVGGAYGVYTDEHGGQLFAHRHPDGTLVGCNPHTQGDGRFRIVVQRVIPSERFPLDGLVVGQLMDGQPGVPLAFAVPDFRLHASYLTPGTEATFQVVGFPIEPNGFYYAPNEEALRATPFGRLAPSGALIPSGLFQPGGGPINPPLPRAILAGPVISVRNVPTARSVWRCKLKTLGGSATVSADAGLFAQDPEEGGLIAGSFYLSAILIDPLPNPMPGPERSSKQSETAEPPQRRGLLSRLRGR
jgi:hypothetical protein